MFPGFGKELTLTNQWADWPALRNNKMNSPKFANLLGLGLVLTVAVAGCKTQHYGTTKLPDGSTASSGTTLPQGSQVNPGEKPGESIPTTPITNPDVRKDWPRDAKIFEADTVHFAYDSTVIKEEDKSKVAAVADYLKAHTETALEIDGHADERGTEEYNRALGERRALALREELARLGVDATRIDTTSYGKDKPVDTGHTEAAHKKNRRGEFLLETPPK